MRKFYSVCVVALIASVMSLSFMASAQAQSIDQMLAAPKVDDIYVARVDKISDAEFEGTSIAFGLIRVIDVSADEIVVITEDGAWEIVGPSVKEMRGDFSEITWDDTEEIIIPREKLASLKKDETILHGRRLTAEQIKEYLNRD